MIFQLKMARRWRAEYPAVFGEATVFSGRGEKDVSFILGYTQKNTLSLAHAIRHPDEAPNRKLARKICETRMLAFMRLDMHIGEALATLYAMNADASSIQPLDDLRAAVQKLSFDRKKQLPRFHVIFGDDPWGKLSFLPPSYLAWHAAAFFATSIPKPPALDLCGMNSSVKITQPSSLETMMMLTDTLKIMGENAGNPEFDPCFSDPMDVGW